MRAPMILGVLVAGKILLVAYLFVYWFIIYPLELRAEEEGWEFDDEDDDEE